MLDRLVASWTSPHGRKQNSPHWPLSTPIPASSRNTVRHRLNRGGDRSLNSALHMVTVSKMTHDAETRAYVVKRRAEDKTDRDIRRCLKHYIARRVFRTLDAESQRMQPA